MDCTRADIHRKSIYELDYADDNSYRETISGTAELKIGAAGQSYSPKSLMKTEGEFLGADCGAFGAKSLKELGITPAFMSAMAGGG